MIEAVRDVGSLDDIVEALGPRPAGGRAIALIGGADFTDDTLVAALRGLFATVAAHCEATGTAIVDGGTDSGVMRLIGEARAGAAATFPLIGVAPAGALRRPTRTGAPIELARHHSLILLVPGSAFGDETDLLLATADHLAGGLAPTLLVNGGALAAREAERRIGAGGVVIAVEGSGRAADDFAARLETDEGLRASGRLRTISVSTDEAGLARGLAA